MKTTGEVAALRKIVGGLPRPLGFVPTMGALHAGHVTLVKHARAECASVAASIFVNPTQFGAGEDFSKYPRDLANDTKILSDAGVDVLFAPDEATMYPLGFTTTVDVGPIGAVFEGVARPNHFAGVATVMTKLLNIVQPDVLYIGQKDAQQTAVLRKLVRDLEIDTEVRIVPTVREADGLALSSRNVYLDPGERAVAAGLHRALVNIRDAMLDGSTKEDAIRDSEMPSMVEPLYLDIVDADTFEPLDTPRPPAFIIGAARLGMTRLIDNIWLTE